VGPRGHERDDLLSGLALFLVRCRLARLPTLERDILRRTLMANTCAGVEDYLLRPWIIRTYRDLFPNVGYHREVEEIFHSTKNGVDIEVLISLFAKVSSTDSAK